PAGGAQGLGVAGLGRPAGEVYPRSRAGAADQDPDPGQGSGAAFGDRAVRRAVTFQGAGFLTGGLTPECAQLVGTVLAALAAPAGAGGGRAPEQRGHDAPAQAEPPLAAPHLP